MSEYMSSCSLDMALLKNYMKSIGFSILIPIVYAIFNGNLILGMSFSMSVIAMTSGYTFSIAEKNDLNRLYGILPVRRSELVIGKYCCMALVGVAALVFSLIAQTLILVALGKTVTANEILISAIFGIFSFLIYISFQIPGYYKMGAIKGRVFMYIPILGFIGVVGISKILKTDVSPAVAKIMSSQMMMFAVSLAFTLIILIGSILLSIHILKRKEL